MPALLLHSFHSATPKETYDIAAQIVGLLKEKGVISLEGPLGAGKTHFVKGAALALGITEEVTSPTFTLLQSYGARGKRVHHFDFYRLESEEEALDLGLEDYFSEGITIIEWGNKYPSLLPLETLHIKIEPLEKENRSILVYSLPNY